MKTKITQTIPAVLALILIAFSYFGYGCAEAKQCFAASFFWDNTFSLLEPIKIYGLFIFIPSIVVIFVEKEVFNSWLRLATWLVPISALIIFVTPVTSNSWMPLYFISREEVAWYLGILFATLSLLLITWKFIALRRNRPG